MGRSAPGFEFFRRRFGWGLLIALAMGVSHAAAQNLSLQPVASGLSQPLFVTAPAGDSRLFIVEKGGIIKVQSAPGATPTNFLNLGSAGLNLINTSGERGLLGMAFDPDYATNGRFYVDYIDRVTFDTKVARYTVSANPNVANTTGTVVLTVDQTVTVSGSPNEFTNHKAGWIGFRPGEAATNLYVATGDGGNSDDPGLNAQNLNSNRGKNLRIDVSGAGAAAPAAGNPFIGATPGNDEIWAYGLRNPFRNSFDRDTAHFYIGDVGQGTREEVDIEEAPGTGGRNYGWRPLEGSGDNPGVGDAAPGNATGPVFDYLHGGSTFSPAGQSGSITGGYVYRGRALPAIDGTYFFADFVTGKIGSFIYDPATNALVPGSVTDRTPQLDPTGTLFGANAISSFGEDGLGELYFVDINGEVFKLVPEPGAATTTLALGAMRRRER
jgi:glucose/arabinose dehydrogenase